MNATSRSIFLAMLMVFSTTAAAKCEVSDEQRAEASRLDWESFDQRGGTPGSFRDLVNEQCYTESIEAYRAWLTYHGDFPNGRARGVGMFHIGQALAFTGNTDGAVSMIKQAFRDEATEGAPAVDWNAYVSGVLAYFDRDQDRILEARSKLETSDRAFAKRRIVVLDGLRRCIHEPYHLAMSNECRR